MRCLKDMMLRHNGGSSDKTGKVNREHGETKPFPEPWSGQSQDSRLEVHTLEQRLVEKGAVSPDDLARALETARRAGRPLVSVLLDEGLGESDRFLDALSEHYRLRVVRLDEEDIGPDAVASLPARLAVHYQVAPVRLAGKSLTIAVANPVDMASVEDIEANLGLHVERVLASRRDIHNALRRFYGVGAETVERILSSDSAPEQDRVPAEAPQDLARMAEDASVVKLVNQLLQDAITDRATDIHLEAHEDGICVRRRMDGVLYDTNMPRNVKLLYPAIISRIKLMSGLDIVERRLPQDGRARVRIGRDEYDLRVSVVPSIHGEDVVLRILPRSMLFDLAQLGFSPEHLKMLTELISRPHGILFVTGPTGSGKSTTLYACLSRLNTRERKIITIEDPVEYELRGITQTQINARIGLTFARALRSMLRHDPDIMMVGEVRDPETAEIAIQTAMTGHLVLSTLHTNDAASGAVRLIDMGAEPYLVASSVLAFTAQRLVRTLCRDCRQSEARDGRTFYRPRGCRQCGMSGYRGRTVICEFLPMTPEIQELVLRRASAQDIRKKADSLGMKTMLQDGEDKIAAGLTTREEIMRVMNV